MSSSSPSLRIDFISDVSCPWCAIGLKSLEQAVQSLPELQVDLHFQPFELNPQMAPEGEEINAHLARKYGASAAQLEQTREAIRQRGAELGFTFTKGARDRIYNTFDAHRLLHWAGLQGGAAQRDLKLALLTAYFTEGRNPGDHQVLRRATESVGLDGEAAASVLASDQFSAEVRQAESEWQAAGINSVPAIVINQRHLIQGGQPPEVFAQALRQIAATAEGGPRS
ncbi:disulfide bond formation protein DsbA [Paucibacter aquatile]|uniref:Disulfide bond formation protein DsbA n=1 Tax=Kinneretia aquatilis TaxID=2070761 RepID=A0A2N8KTT8_9BURK|nr:DsbA family oxidoreductase [Paucibacter aquatile]PND36888.1 disulfide bond formation protein DsbA [Paucibacter aquatile]